MNIPGIIIPITLIPIVNAITKGWINFDYSASSTRDSLNVASTTDNAQGDHTFSHTNNFNNEGY